MASTDAAAQTSFYADHLDRYFLRTGVNRAFVLRDKQDFLRRGMRVRRFQLEDVEIQDETSASARVRLVKHYVVDRPEPGASGERSVHSELQLKKFGGAWKIVAERDFWR